VGSLRTINTACVTYQTTYQSQGFPTALSQLGPAASATSATADLVDSVLAAGTKSGYTFVLAQVGSGTPSTGYSVVSAPQNPQVTGVRGFYTDQSGVIRADTSGTATSTSSPLQ
jgi:type IV pilus assembly protein PilA